MKTLTKIIVYTICLQLSVGTYPIQRQLAYAQDNASRDPASDNLNMSAEEVVDHSKNYIHHFSEQCVGPNGEIKANVAFMHDKEIGGEEPRMYNCDAAAEVIQKIIIPGMNDVFDAAKYSKIDPNCPTCGIPNQEANLQESEPTQEGASCSIADQKKYAKTAASCDAWCGVSSVLSLGQNVSKSCDSSYKNASVSGKCLLDIAKGVAKGIWDVLAFIPKMIWDGVKWGWKKLFSETETKTSEKCHALAGLTDEQIKLGKSNPEALKQTLLQKAGMFFKEFGKAIIGYPEYEEKSKCTDCAGKAELMCGVIGNAGGFLITMFGNGLIFGAAEGLGTKIASKIIKFSKGASKVAKFTAKTIEVGAKTGKYVAKPFISFGNVIVKGVAKVSITSMKWWEKFKAGKVFENLAKFKNTGIYKKAFSAESIPGKITLKIGHTVGKGFDKMSTFEDRMFMKGVGLTNKELKTTMLRAENINKLRAARIAAESKTSETSAATNEALRGVDELKVVKDASDGRTAEQWAALKKTAVNELSDIKAKNLDDIENAVKADFNIGVGKEKSILVETSKGTREIKLANPSEVENIHTYQDAKYAFIQNKDGSYILHDMDSGSHLTQVKRGKGEIVDALLGKKTKTFDDLETASYDQVKTNLKINGSNFTEESNTAGEKSLKIETPNGCNPKTLSFGVDKAI